MPKSLSASKKVMKNYLSELLTEDVLELPNIEEKKQLERLLQNVSVAESKPKIEVAQNKKIKAKEVVNKNVEELSIVTAKSQGGFKQQNTKVYRQGEFQAMFFDVAGLLIAVPLIELGGIHKVEKTTPLMGKPPWYTGVMVHRGDKINIVDTAMWIMPEKCTPELKKSINYQYIIMLGNSKWGLSAEKLIDTVIVKQDEVKWLDTPNKRPWLAGLVKDRMCALVDVGSLIHLLDVGLGM